jgi:Tfp pilus assembly protein PilV
MIKFLKQKNTGFTLVETLVSISIFSMAILGLLSILASGITNTTYAKQKITADYLAQEGIEYIRNMRDTFVLYDATNAQTGWNSFNTKLTTAPASCSAGSGCYFDDQNIDYTNHSQPMANIILNTCSSSCPSLLYNSSTGKYGYASGVDSGFIRKIQITTISPDEIKISSNVSWKQGSGNYNITFSEDLFNWIQ